MHVGKKERARLWGVVDVAICSRALGSCGRMKRLTADGTIVVVIFRLFLEYTMGEGYGIV